MNTAIYTGWVRHRRFVPRSNQFRYQVMMMYVDLAEVDSIFNKGLLVGRRCYSLIRFKRSDYFGDASKPLDICVREKVAKETGVYPKGRICLLSNVRYFNMIINPISTYYCYDEQNRLTHLLLEVTNTPWGEKCQYVLKADSQRFLRAVFKKEMHVSPFMGMDYEYHWRSDTPGERAAIHLENRVCQDVKKEKHLDATLVLQKQGFSRILLIKALIQYPLMTVKVALCIYWQALKLWFKKVPFISHPS